jgi:hypothetical protein
MKQLWRRRLGVKPISLVTAAVVGLVLVTTVVIYEAYRRGIIVAQSHAELGSHAVATPCGTIEYAESGKGTPVLVVQEPEGDSIRGYISGARWRTKAFASSRSRGSAICARPFRTMRRP